MYMAGHRKEEGSEAKGCATAEPLQPYSWPTADKSIPSDVGDVKSQRFVQAKRKTGLEKFTYRVVFRGDEVVERSGSKKLEMTA